MNAELGELETALDALRAAQAQELTAFLLPVLALVVWTLVMWVWMFATRIPAMQAAKIDPNKARHPDSGHNEKLPSSVRAVADNYNHLHEQPTVFYALMAFAALTGGADTLGLFAAWTYVALRVVHSLVQALSSAVLVRFLVFVLASLALFVLAGKEVVRVLG